MAPPTNDKQHKKRNREEAESITSEMQIMWQNWRANLAS